jgi:hypothetical protein
MGMPFRNHFRSVGDVRGKPGRRIAPAHARQPVDPMQRGGYQDIHDSGLFGPVGREFFKIGMLQTFNADG